MSHRISKTLKMASSTAHQKPRAPQLTHFLCIPLMRHATPSASNPTTNTNTNTRQETEQLLSANLATFKQDVTRPAKLGGFDLHPDAVRPPGTLHLTLGMMSFPSKGSKGKGEEASDLDGGAEGKKKSLAYAVEVLRALKPREIMECTTTARRQASVTPGAATVTATATRKDHHDDAPSPRLSITLQGLHPMQKSLDKTTVLYAPPTDPDGTLQAFAEAIRGIFQDAGLLVVDDRPLLLHTTIVNTVYIKGRNNYSTKQGPRGKREMNVIKDVQGILDRYEEHLWVQDMPLDRIAICRMGAKPVVVDGEVVDAMYEVEAENEF